MKAMVMKRAAAVILSFAVALTLMPVLSREEAHAATYLGDYRIDLSGGEVTYHQREYDPVPFTIEGYAELGLIGYNGDAAEGNYRVVYLDLDMDSEHTSDMMMKMLTSDYLQAHPEEEPEVILGRLSTSSIDGSITIALSDTDKALIEQYSPGESVAIYDSIEFDFVKMHIPAMAELSCRSFVYNGEVQRPEVTVTVNKGGALFLLTPGQDYSVEYIGGDSVDAGTYGVQVESLNEKYDCGVLMTYEITKADNTLKASGKTGTVKYSKLKKKSQTLKASSVLKFASKGEGKRTYKKYKGNKKITISKTSGKVTVKKGLKKGTYTMKVKIQAAGDANHEASKWKTVTFKVRVK